MDDPTTYLVSFDDAEARYVVFICLESHYNSFVRMYTRLVLLIFTQSVKLQW